jgi:predicted DsbA family dithiol-disulfide isomerase
VQIEVWSDTVCPWCYIGLKRLQRALQQRPDRTATVRWLPFELNPDLPVEGMDRRDYMFNKFGDPDRFKNMQGQMRALTQDLGIDYRPELQTRMPNTRRSHMLIAAAANNQQTELTEALFRAYFSSGRDIGTVETLLDVAVETGLPRDWAQGALDDSTLATDIETQQIAARRAEISGVPFFVFDRKFAISGAQEVTVFLQAIDRC